MGSKWKNRRVSPAAAQVSSNVRLTKQALDQLWWLWRHKYLVAKRHEVLGRMTPVQDD